MRKTCAAVMAQTTNVTARIAHLRNMMARQYLTYSGVSTGLMLRIDGAAPWKRRVAGTNSISARFPPSSSPTRTSAGRAPCWPAGPIPAGRLAMRPNEDPNLSMSEKAPLDRDRVTRTDIGVQVDLGRPMRGVFISDDENLVDRAALLESAGDGDGLAHVQARLEGIGAGFFDHAVDEERSIFVDRHRHPRIDEVPALQAVGEQLLDFADGATKHRNFAENRKRYRSCIGKSNFLAGEIVLSKNPNRDHVSRIQPVRRQCVRLILCPDIDAKQCRQQCHHPHDRWRDVGSESEVG